MTRNVAGRRATLPVAWRVIADLYERDAIVAVLKPLGLDQDPPTIARARDPTYDVA